MRRFAGSIMISVALAACGGSDGSSLDDGDGSTGDDTLSSASASMTSVGVDGGAEAGTVGVGDDGTVGSDGDDSSAASSGEPGGTTSADVDDGASSGEPVGETGGSGTEPPEDALLYEPFDAPDGAPWQAPWEALGGLLDHEITSGRGRLQGQAATVGRMLFPSVDAADVDATATVIFEDWWHQGFGLYVRQNGGYLVNTQPNGQGYALYVEGGFMQSIGVWRERAGVEELVSGTTVDGDFLESGTAYHVRFRCTQEGGETRLQAKIWPAAQAEPAGWDVDVVDATPELQDTSGALAVDIYNYQGTASILLDDITLMPAD